MTEFSTDDFKGEVDEGVVTARTAVAKRIIAAAHASQVFGDQVIFKEGTLVFPPGVDIIAAIETLQAEVMAD